MLVKKADKSAVFDGYLSNSSGTLSPRAPLLIHCFLLYAFALSRFFDSLENLPSGGWEILCFYSLLLQPMVSGQVVVVLHHGLFEYLDELGVEIKPVGGNGEQKQ